MKEIIKECKHHGKNQPHAIDSDGRERCKKCRSEAVVRSRKKRKQKLVDYRGGKCELCGYGKCCGALEFHHIDPEQKEFGLSVRGLTRSWKEMVQECMKCILICANCHREIHDGMAQIPEDYEPTVDENVLSKEIKNSDDCRTRPYKEKDIRKCKNCNNEYQAKAKHQKYCSMKCSSASNARSNRPSKQELKELIENNPYTKIGKMFDVSDNTIRKWAKSYKLID